MPAHQLAGLQTAIGLLLPSLHIPNDASIKIGLYRKGTAVYRKRKHITGED